MAEVNLSDVTKVYPGGVRAVIDANLTVGDGEFVVLVGPSGCGKTTTLRMIAGLEEITNGQITIAGKVVNNVAPKDRDIAMVFQNYALYPHMTVYKNMAFGLRMRKFARKEIDRRVQDAAKLLGIEELLARRPKALSGGQRQRVAVGRAIVRDPKAFLFDEPLSNLDAKLRGVMRAELKELHRRLQTTTVYVTHDQEEAMSLGDRIVVMLDGVIRQCGHPLSIYDHPTDRFVAGFVGMPPMNFFDGVVHGNNGALTFETQGQTVVLPERMKAELQPYLEKEMVLGVRPEHLTPREQGGEGSGNGYLEMEVSVAEPLGHCQDVYLSFGDQRVVSRCDSHIRVPQKGTIAVDLLAQRIHVFEPGDLGKNVTLEAMDSGNDV